MNEKNQQIEMQSELQRNQEDVIKQYQELKVQIDRLQDKNTELCEVIEQKDARLERESKQAKDDATKIQKLEAQIKDDQDYIEKLIFEKDQSKEKAHNLEKELS